MTFSQKLKYILSEQNISQAELSRLTGINKSSICQYLSGKNIPSKKRQGVIATAIGMPEDYFGNENFNQVYHILRFRDLHSRRRLESWACHSEHLHLLFSRVCIHGRRLCQGETRKDLSILLMPLRLLKRRE
jgi:transcriptional regulator with XRE-family HTH domain